jgi:hypothetical protein
MPKSSKRLSCPGAASATTFGGSYERNPPSTAVSPVDNRSNADDSRNQSCSICIELTFIQSQLRHGTIPEANNRFWHLASTHPDTPKDILPIRARREAGVADGRAKSRVGGAMEPLNVVVPCVRNTAMCRCPSILLLPESVSQVPPLSDAIRQTRPAVACPSLPCPRGPGGSIATIAFHRDVTNVPPRRRVESSNCNAGIRREDDPGRRTRRCG